MADSGGERFVKLDLKRAFASVKHSAFSAILAELGAPPPLPQASTYHYAGPSGQAQLSAQQIADKVAADRDGGHQVWMAGWPGWKSASEVSEIMSLVPPAPALPSGSTQFICTGGGSLPQKGQWEGEQVALPSPFLAAN